VGYADSVLICLELATRTVFLPEGSSGKSVFREERSSSRNAKLGSNPKRLRLGPSLGRQTFLEARFQRSHANDMADSTDCQIDTAESRSTNFCPPTKRSF